MSTETCGFCCKTFKTKSCHKHNIVQNDLSEVRVNEIFFLWVEDIQLIMIFRTSKESNNFFKKSEVKFYCLTKGRENYLWFELLESSRNGDSTNFVILHRNLEDFVTVHTVTNSKHPHIRTLLSGFRLIVLLFTRCLVRNQPENVLKLLLKLFQK